MNSISPDRRSKFKNNQNNGNRRERLRNNIRENQQKLRNQLLDKFRTGLNFGGDDEFSTKSIDAILDPATERMLMYENNWTKEDIESLKEEMKYILEEEAAFQAEINAYQNSENLKQK